ncbi:hypothetical protein FACS1894123_01840 [Bacteroidia bacterium]|nr:hypothetical protein FACS1894123_01840 [Bacteroidia bacterium]
MEVIPEETCTKQVFSVQREKLKPLFFHDWNQVLIKSFYAHYQENVETWNGMKVWALDGSTITLPDTEDRRERFGYSSNQRGDCQAIARVSVVHRASIFN